MEPNTAVADVRADRAEIWTGAKTPVYATQLVAETLGLAEDRVTLHVIATGGSFGRRLFYDAPVQAAQISQRAGRPVKLLYTREDDTRHGRNRPASIHHVRATVRAGDVVSFEHRMAGAGIDFRHGFGERATATAAQRSPDASGQFVFNLSQKVPYRVGATSLTLAEQYLAVPTGSWRSVYSGPVATLNEIVIDELARLLGRDEYEYRREMLDTDRARAVLDTAAHQGRWGRPLPAGVAQGLGMHQEFKSVVAFLVECDARRRRPRITRATVAVDVGRTVNPTGLEAQMRGVTIDAIAAVFRAGLHLEGGRIREGEDVYRHWAWMGDSPFEIDVHILAPTQTCPAAPVSSASRRPAPPLPTPGPGRRGASPAASLSKSTEAEAMPAFTFFLNGAPVSVDADGGEPLLWVLRERLGLTGSKYGCGSGLCGICTAHVDGRPRRLCITPVRAVAGHRVTTIEGLAGGGVLHPVQQAWIDEDVAQCGYCQAGQIMAAVALLARNPNPSDADIDAAMGVMCRCGTYYAIRRAIKRAAATASSV